MTRDQYIYKRNQLLAKAQQLLDSGSMDEYKACIGEINKLDDDYNNYAREQANLNAISGSVGSVPDIAKSGNVSDVQGNVYGSKAEMYNSIEYRTALMNNFLAGEPIPEKFMNAAAQTKTSDVTSVVPTVWIQKIIQKLDNSGGFLSLVTQTNYKGGVNIPTSDMEFEATWCNERGTSVDQKVSTGTVTFSYHKLRCVVALSFEVDTVTLEIFETAVINGISKSMNKALERAIFVGTGAANHQPKGFLTETPCDGQALEIAEGRHFTYQDIIAAEAALPEEYENEAIWTMTKKTYFNEVLGMVDDNGQPIARIDSGINGKPEYTILGRPVKFNKYMQTFSTSVSADTIVAAIFDFSKFGLNTNYALTLKSYIDEDTDDRKIKGLMLADGKVFDKNSLVTITVKNGT